MWFKTILLLNRKLKQTLNPDKFLQFEFCKLFAAFWSLAAWPFLKIQPLRRWHMHVSKKLLGFSLLNLACWYSTGVILKCGGRIQTFPWVLADGCVRFLRNYRECRGVSGTVLIGPPVSELPAVLNNNTHFCASLKTHWIRICRSRKWESVFLTSSASDSRTQILEKYCFRALLGSPSLFHKTFKLRVCIKMLN